MDRYLKIHQARTADPTPYEVKLAKAIEEVFGLVVSGGDFVGPQRRQEVSSAQSECACNNP